MIRQLHNVLLLLTAASCIIAANANAQPQTAAVSGTVSDAASGAPLAGASVLVAGTALGTSTSADGRFRLEGLAAGSYTLEFSYVGYQNLAVSVTLNAGDDRELTIALTAGVELDPIQITAGRRQAKVLDAPASVDVVGVRELEEETGPTAVEALRNLAGVDIAQTAYDRSEVVLRGFNNAFSASVYTLTDYRQAGLASLGANVHSVMPGLGIDLERIEIVRGPGSALYGAGVDEGVIHYVTKSAITYPGATIAISGGDRSFMDVQGRIAVVSGDKIGVKVVGKYSTVNNFGLEGCAAQIVATQGADACPDPHDARQIAAYGERDDTSRRMVLYGNLEYRPAAGTSLQFSGGHSLISSTTLTGIGVSQAVNWGYSYAQLQLQSGGFFAQAYVNQNNAGDSYLYGGDAVVDKSRLVNFQAQYDLSLFSGREQVVFGVDLDLTQPDTEGTIHGRFEDMDEINEFGAYAQSLTRIGSRLELTLAARADYSNIVDGMQFSPRAALVFKPAPAHSIRTTFNRAFSSPLATRVFLDLVVGNIPGTGINVRGLGRSEGFSWERNPSFLTVGAPTDLVASSLVPGSEGVRVPVGLPTADVYGAIYAGLAAIPAEELARQVTDAGVPLTAPVATLLVQLLSPDMTPVGGFSPGVLGLLNLTTAEVESYVDDLMPLDPLTQTVSQTYEAGYKGIISDRILVAVDGYYGRKKNFIGPLGLESPFVFVPNLAQDLTRDIAAGITSNQGLAALLGAAGLSPEAVAGLLVQLAAQTGALPTATTPVAIVQPVENNRGEGASPELLLTYRNFGEITYYGMDAGVQILATDQLRLFANFSWVSDDLFDSEELGESGQNVSLALNASPLKAKFGGSYRLGSGLSFNGSARYHKGFPVRSGVHIGDIDSYFLVDLGARYEFGARAEGLSLGLGISNALNNVHRQFIGAPKLGRIARARLTYNFGLQN